jgi:hypothetical protein
MKTEFNFFPYVNQHFRDLPEDDLDYGFPLKEGESARPEVEALVAFLRNLPRVDVFVHLRGTVVGGGAQFLVWPSHDNAWPPLFSRLESLCAQYDVPLGDFNLFGQRGYERLRKGFQTLPTTEDMREFFRQGDPDYAEAFRLSFWEYLQRHHGLKYALTVEIPLVIEEGLNDMGPSGRYRVSLEEERARHYLRAGEDLEQALERVPTPGKEEQKAAQWVDYYRRGAHFHRTYGRALWEDRDRFESLQATRRDVQEVELQGDLLRFLPLAAPLHVLRLLQQPNARGLQAEYIEALKRLFFDFRQGYRWFHVPLQRHIQLHMATLLTVLPLLEAIEE